MSNNTGDIIKKIKEEIQNLITEVKNTSNSSQLANVQKENVELRAKIKTLEQSLQEMKTKAPPENASQPVYTSEYYILHEDTWILMPCTLKPRRKDELRVIFSA